MRRPHILVVDDNPMNQKLIELVLSSESYEISTAANAPEALACVERAPPRLILMDLQLPGMDGLELTRLLKANPRTQSILIVAVTAYAMRGDDERAFAAGCDGYITKPIDTRALPVEIARLLARGR